MRDIDSVTSAKEQKNNKESDARNTLAAATHAHTQKMQGHAAFSHAWRRFLFEIDWKPDAIAHQIIQSHACVRSMRVQTVASMHTTLRA